MHVQVDHPCVQHKLAIIRHVETGHKRFRELSTEITQFLCYEALKKVKTKEVEVETPLAVAACPVLSESEGKAALRTWPHSATGSK